MLQKKLNIAKNHLPAIISFGFSFLYSCQSLQCPPPWSGGRKAGVSYTRSNRFPSCRRNLTSQIYFFSKNPPIQKIFVFLPVEYLVKI